MAITISSAANIARLQAAADAVVGLIDAGAAAGYVEIRTGAKPATPGDAATGTLLGTLTFDDPAFGAATAADPAVATAGAITGDTSADASGEAGYFRVYDSNDVAIFDGTVTDTGSGGDMELNDASIVAGGTIDITSFTFSQASS